MKTTELDEMIEETALERLEVLRLLLPSRTPTIMLFCGSAFMLGIIVGILIERFL